MVRLICRLAIAGLAAALSACGPGPAPIGPPAGPPVDEPPSQVISPTPGLRLTASLDHSRLTSGASVVLRVDLKNEGAIQIQLPGGDPCNPALQAVIWDSGNQVVWSEPARMCAVRGESATPLQPGASLNAAQCFTVSAGPPPGAQPNMSCVWVGLQPGTYQFGGTFYGKTLPRLRLTVV